MKTSKKNQGFCLFPSGVEQTGTKFKTAVIWLGAWIGSYWSSLSVIGICLYSSVTWIMKLVFHKRLYQ